MARLLQRTTVPGRPIPVASGTIVPLARRWLLRLPGDHGGLIWKRPLGVLVRGSDGTERRLAVTDWTRIGQLALLVGALMAAFVFWRGRSGGEGSD